MTTSPPIVAKGPRIVRPDPQAQAAQAPVLARLVRGEAYHRNDSGESFYAHLAERLGWLALPLALAAVLLTRAGQVSPLEGVIVLTIAVTVSAAALGIALVAGIDIWRHGSRGSMQIFRATVLAVLVLAYPAHLAVQALRLPILNDVSTDLADPPVYSTLARTLASREGVRPLDVPQSRRLVQAKAWPQIRPLNLDMEEEEAFSVVVDALKSLKWKVIEQSRPDDFRGRGRIEATVYTPLMHLAHDITIRFRWTGEVTRVDIRAQGRFGRHDFGANAALVQKLVNEITAPVE